MPSPSFQTITASNPQTEHFLVTRVFQARNSQWRTGVLYVNAQSRAVSDNDISIRSRKTSCVTLTRNVQCKDVPVQDMMTWDSGGRAPLIDLSNTWRWMVESQLPVPLRAPQSRFRRFAQEKAPLPSPESKEANCQGTERFARHSITWSSCYIRKSDACLTAWRQYIYKKVKFALE